MLSGRSFLSAIRITLLIIAALAIPEAFPAQAAEESGWHRINSAIAPLARHDHVLVAAGNKLLLTGGRASGKPLSDTWLFDLQTEIWREVRSTPAPEARFGSAATYDAERKRILLFAGQQTGFFNDVWAFDLASEQWSKLETTGSAPVARYGTSAVIDSVQDALIISHGFARGRFDDTFALDLKTNTWKDISPQTRPLKRCLHESVYDSTNKRMLLFGGCSSGFGPCPQGDLWSFDLASGEWTEIKPQGNVPAPRSNPALIADDMGSAWLFGGRGERGVFYNDLWRYDVTSERWEKIATTSGPAARSSHDAVWDVVNKRLFVFGGLSEQGDLNDTWVYKP